MRQCGEGCDGAVDAMLQCQKVSDFLIAASYLSIPLELLYFASCADLAPIKWLLLQLASFAVLGGAIHMLAVLTHHHPHSSRLLLASTVAKVLAALVSFATSLSLLTFIPLLIRVKLREALLRTKARQLDRDVGLIRRRVEATSRVVRMLSHHICSYPLDPHAILHTTMLHLGDALSLHSCAVWLPADHNVLQMVHQLSLRDKGTVVLGSQVHISADDPDVFSIQSSEVARVLRQGSALATASGNGRLQPPGAVAAIRMPMLKVSNFDGGRTPEASSYAILVLVLPSHHDRSSCKRWSSQDLELVQVVADQVAVALSHAAVLEEWQSTRDTLAEQHRALARAKHEATVQAGAISSSQSAMCGAVRRQMHSIVGLLSMLVRQEENTLHPEQRLAVDAMSRTSALSLTLMDTETLTKKINRAPFGLHSLIREAMAVTRCLAGCSTGFSYQSTASLPEWVVGDETRVFHLLLHMVGTLLLPPRRRDGDCLSFSVTRVNAGCEGDGGWNPTRSSLSPGCSICLKFQVRMEQRQTLPWRSPQRPSTSSSEINELSFSMCNKIVQMMNGSMWSSSPSDDGGEGIITVVLQFQLQQSGVYRNRTPAIPRFRGLRILLADNDDMSRVVTRKLLDKLGCQVMSVPSGGHCLGMLRSAGECFQMVLLDLDVPGEEEDVFEVALRIRELGNSSCWLLVVAALDVRVVDDGVRDMCQRAGINCVVQKPITLTALGDQLVRVLGNN